MEPVVKLLDDVATYEWPTTALSAERRVAVFEAAAPRHPLLDATIDLILERYRDLLKRGAVLVDPDDAGTQPRAFC